MKKYRFFIDIGKEEKWLNEMARKGYDIVSKDAFGGYSFQTKEPQDTNVRIDYRLFKNNTDFQDYRMLFQDSGWNHIAGNKNSGTQYFKMVDTNAVEDIFSDNASKAGRYKRLSNMWLSLFIVFLPLMYLFIHAGFIDVNAMLNPKLLYYTPGLWEKTGMDFWGSFLFETPFALMRGFLWLAFPATVLLYLYSSVKCYSL